MIWGPRLNKITKKQFPHLASSFGKRKKDIVLFFTLAFLQPFAEQHNNPRYVMTATL